MTTYTSPQDGTTLDTFIYSGDPTANYATNASLFSGNVASGTYRSLLQFPGISSVDQEILFASLFLKIAFDNSSNSRTFRVFRSKRDVNISQCTWNIWKTGSSWSTAGGFGTNDCEQTDIGSVILTASETIDAWIEIPLVPSAVQEIANGKWTTPTLLIKPDTENLDRYGFYSTNYTTSVYRPYVVITYESGLLRPIWFM